jgi:hypothetical protein
LQENEKYKPDKQGSLEKLNILFVSKTSIMMRKNVTIQENQNYVNGQ